jgi:hypothetical protein
VRQSFSWPQDDYPAIAVATQALHCQHLMPRIMTHYETEKAVFCSKTQHNEFHGLLV